MRTLSMMITGTAAAVSVLAFVASAAPTAKAAPYCTYNTSGMHNCSFVTLEQCKATVSGVFGNCYLNPYESESRSVYAMAPKPKAYRR